MTLTTHDADADTAAATELETLRRECLALAAPLIRDTDDTTASAIAAIRTYVVALENRVADLAGGLAAIADAHGPEADVDAEKLHTLAAAHRVHAMLHATRA